MARRHTGMLPVIPSHCPKMGGMAHIHNPGVVAGNVLNARAAESSVGGDRHGVGGLPHEWYRPMPREAQAARPSFLQARSAVIVAPVHGVRRVVLKVGEER